MAVALFVEQLDAVAPGGGFAFAEVDVSAAAAHGAGQEVVGDHEFEDVGGDAGGVGDFGQLDVWRLGQRWAAPSVRRWC